jgi:uncharacterized membrane protein
MNAGPAPQATDPVVLPGSNNQEMTDHVCGIALRERSFLWWRIAVAPFALLTAVLFWVIVWLFYAGIGIWGVDWPVMWGFALINYVWWIAVLSNAVGMAQLSQSYRRIHDAVRRSLCGNLSDPASRPTVVRLLAVSLSGDDAYLAAVSQPAALGLFRYLDLCSGFDSVLVSGADP